ncbi:CheY-like superfamily [Ochromonadaceae sp. CCMP2298]|nr:CheY-like superfamily [Ochromonadaceae sp. CCMP2298]
MLVLDDAVSNRKLLMRIFRLKGFVCEEAYDGQDALQKYANMCAQGTPPAAILMDFEMPVLNGPSATRLLREQGCSCLIIGVTGNVMRADKDFFISCGADAVFAKPINAEIVMTLLTKIATPRAGAGGAGNKGGAGDRGEGTPKGAGRGGVGAGDGVSGGTLGAVDAQAPPPMSAHLPSLQPQRGVGVEAATHDVDTSHSSLLTSASTSVLSPSASPLLTPSASAYGFSAYAFSAYTGSSKITPSADEPDAPALLRASLTPTHTTPTPTTPIAQTHTPYPADMHP